MRRVSGRASSSVKFGAESAAILAFIFFGFISSQRFAVPFLSAYSVIPFFLVAAFVFRSVVDLRTTVLICLLGSVDLGGGVYAETPGGIRYILYALVFWAILSERDAAVKRGMWWLWFLPVVFTLNTLLHPYRIDFYFGLRDVLTLALLLLIFGCSSRDKSPFQLRMIVSYGMGVLLSELLNVVAFYSVSSGDYLNYSSLKFAVMAPFLFYFLMGRYGVAVALLIPTVVILVAYGSRMLTLTTAALIVVLLLSLSVQRTLRTLLALAAVFVSVGVLLRVFDVDLQAYRAASFVIEILEGGNLSTLFESLDRIRYLENQVFFSQDGFHLAFGNGFGAGIFDPAGLFSFIPDDGAAYSSRELSESHYFRLHDSWTWFGYRFGLLPFLIFLFFILKNVIGGSNEGRFMASLLFLALFNASFSVSGILVTCMLASKLISTRHVLSETSLRSVGDRR